MATPKYNTYIGMRYVPIFDGVWDSTKSYEPLTIVEYQSNSYTSKTFVPAGANITNTEYWALTGNYNAQIEAYRTITEQVASEVDGCVHVYTNVASMKADSELEEGLICKTLGYHSDNDNGDAYYIITSTAPETHYETLNNGLYAMLITNGNAKLEQYGYANIAGIYADNYLAEMKADGIKNILLEDNTYNFNNTLKLETDMSLIGKSKTTSIIAFPVDVSAIQLCGRNSVSNIRINIFGNADALFVYSPETAYYNLNTDVNNIFISHEGNNGCGIHLIAENTGVQNQHEGFYNCVFKNIRVYGTLEYGIRMHNKVKTTAKTEAWITEAIFEDIFFDGTRVAFDSDWEDISGNNAVPHTGDASLNLCITLKNVSAEYSNIADRFANIQNAQNVHFIDCHPFDYYLLLQSSKKLYKFNAHGDMCRVNLGYQTEMSDRNGLISNYVEFDNSTGLFDDDFRKCVIFTVLNSTGRTYANIVNTPSNLNDDLLLNVTHEGTIIARQGRVSGNVLSANIEISLNLDSGSNTIGRFAYGARPYGIITEATGFYGSSTATGTVVRVVIDTTGNVYATAPSALSGGTLRFSATYLRTINL